MKFSLFVHMIRDNPEQSYTKLYEDFIELCQIADQSEMRAIWTGEHHEVWYKIVWGYLLSYVQIMKISWHFTFLFTVNP